MSKDLLKEAIADAKAVRSTAIANARLALEEAFTPKLQSMLSQKIAEEMDDEVTEEEDLETTDTSIDEADDAELEEIIKELEGEDEEVTESEEEEVTESEDEPVDETSNEDETVAESDDEVEEGEELDLAEIIKSLQEEDETVEEEEEVEENKEAELDEAYKTIRFLKSKINEVNLLNSKLLYSNKLFRARNLNESQKMKVIETFDRANSVREVKLVYSTLAESLTAYAPKKKVNESFASRAQGSTKPSKDVIVESNTFATRMQRLAGLK